ncbi:MAG TPA: hypothetical protein PL041_11250, partial [Melioribacteraceae bacterium]|nr:hypothetical protein [Melioribacteraceae bacterium]
MKTWATFSLFFFSILSLTFAQSKMQKITNINNLTIVNCQHENLISSEFIEAHNKLNTPTTFFRPNEIVGLNNSNKIIYTYDRMGLATNEEYYNADSIGWNLQYKWVYTYTAEGKLSSSYFIPNNGSFTNLTTYEYDTNGQLIRITKINNDNEFEKYEYTYYNNGKMKEYYYYLKLANWVAKSGAIYEYDSNLNQISKTNLIEKENVLTYSSRSISTYTQNNLQQTVLEQSHTNYKWTDSKYYTFEYDSLSQLTHKIESIKENNSWKEQIHYYYDYDEQGSLLKYTDKRWVPNAWILNYCEIYTYNENKNILTLTTQIGDGYGNGINELKTTKTYNNIGQITSNLIQKNIN